MTLQVIRPTTAFLLLSHYFMSTSYSTTMSNNNHFLPCPSTCNFEIFYSCPSLYILKFVGLYKNHSSHWSSDEQFCQTSIKESLGVSWLLSTHNNLIIIVLLSYLLYYLLCVTAGVTASLIVTLWKSHFFFSFCCPIWA